MDMNRRLISEYEAVQAATRVIRYGLKRRAHCVDMPSELLYSKSNEQHSEDQDTYSQAVCVSTYFSVIPWRHAFTCLY